MKKADLLKALSESAGMPRRDVEKVMNSLADITSTVLCAGGDVTITGIGRLSAKWRQGRTGRNPKTGQPVQIEGKTSVKFRAAKDLADAVAAS